VARVGKGKERWKELSKRQRRRDTQPGVGEKKKKWGRGKLNETKPRSRWEKISTRLPGDGGGGVYKSREVKKSDTT